MSSNQKLREAINDLRESMQHMDNASKNKFYFAGIAKLFEVCFEYAWKLMKMKATKEGLEVYSPRESIRAAGRLGLIDNVEEWMDFLENRNLSVHDYLGIGDKDYLESIKKFLDSVEKLSKF